MENNIDDSSIAMAIVKDYKKQTFRQFIIICVLLGIILTFAIGVVYIILNFDIDYESTIEEVVTDTGNACIGSDCGNGDINGESVS